MSTFVPKEVQAGLDSARLQSLKEASRLRLAVDGVTYPVLRMWKTGFSMQAETAPYLRGYVDLYDGAIHLFQCLIVAADEEAGEMRYEFKRLTAVSEKPALDFARSEDAPVALLTRQTD
ncbi:hypothetical protein [Tateyamaria sp. ANG-S1]|uniref:hypothetical protein n=1 Tax=Tateyamaria sp. ANG-S1 TaxID=1577905 RepID=UPI00057D0B99|nr:hypothetical protein [Tateyamaria sp. ANG-S1]KIC51970.1 hypothetical protein RA29_01390 [Tateyamaria sp. ANG-S1]